MCIKFNPTQMVRSNVLLLFLFSLFPTFLLSQATDTILSNQALEDGETIVSAGGNFELGFFQRGGSNNRYVGVWYKKISVQTIVWVANRDSPLTDSSGKLILSPNGTLLLFNCQNVVLWSSSTSFKSAPRNPVARILDTGNFVVSPYGNDKPEAYLWQSFDYPGDTFLPGMKYGVNFVTGMNRFLTSWRSLDDPSTGNHSNKLDTSGVPQFFLKRNSVDVFRAGPWNGLRFSGMPNLKPNPIYRYNYVRTDEEEYYTYELISSSVITRMQLNSHGALLRYTWFDRMKSWNFYLSAEMDNCDRYALCGPFGSCNINNSPACGCLKGFVPRSLADWLAGDWSQGCVQKVELDCREREGFLKISGIKVPDTRTSWYNTSMDLGECKSVCSKNCSCTAYANFDIRDGGSGCILWFGDLIDIREYNENGQDIYIRLAASEIKAYEVSNGEKRILKIVAPILCIGLVLIGLVTFFLVSNKKKKLERKVTLQSDIGQVSDRNREEEDLELPLFDFDTIARATDDFSCSSKLGQGGFGPVYKGQLPDGQEIAVKRLSRTSRQGLEEFKNEVKLITKLQHRNLVKILGCCIQEEERMLVYEYLANKSLDSFIFDKEKRAALDWPKRFNIINGIARGLLYLHQDSRLRIIHRDLKASNVLLDSAMTPKISDFGMARTFAGDETKANTTRVVGTYGYMSPEYQIDGLFSVKSDVFSFGVLVLEILSGKRNRAFCNQEHKLNLLGHAWILYKEDRPMELIDTSVKVSCNTSEAIRSVHVGLLCVQQNPEDRPNMSAVVLMLSSDMTLPDPKEPGFFTERNLLFSDSISIQLENPSNNVLTMTMIEAR